MTLSESKQKRTEALVPCLCTAIIKTFCITIQLIFHMESHCPITFSAACAFFHLRSLVSPPFIFFPSFSISHASHLAFTFRFTAAFADVPFTYQIVFIIGSNLPAFSWVWLRKCRNSLQNKRKDPRMRRMSFVHALSLFFSLSPYFLTSMWII